MKEINKYASNFIFVFLLFSFLRLVGDFISVDYAVSPWVLLKPLHYISFGLAIGGFLFKLKFGKK